MIDVMLVLLIIFMVVTPALLAGFNAEPPQGQNLKDHPEDEENDQVLGIDKDGNYYLNKKPISKTAIAAEIKRIYTQRATITIMYLKADKDLDVREGGRCDRHGGQERRSVVGDDQRSEAGHDVHRGGRHKGWPRRQRHQPEVLPNGNGRWWWRRADERDQRHADDRRAARAADHLHGGDPDHAEVDRRAAS